MQRIILLLLIALVFSGCFKEDRNGCPEDMRFTFHMVDKYDPSANYDSRITNNAFFFIFRDNILVYKQIIPYNDIRAGKEYVIRKTPELSGNLRVVSWAVPMGRVVDNFPTVNVGDHYQDVLINLNQDSRADYFFRPILGDSYICSLGVSEPIDQPSLHRVDMVNAYCRVRVNVTDYRGVLRNSETDVVVNGTMSAMNLNMDGAGTEAAVKVTLDCPTRDGLQYTTGQFGVYPSAAGEVVSVDILKDGQVLKTLTLPKNLMPSGAKVGELLVFEYVMDDAEFYVTIDGFKQKVVIVDM